MANKQIDLNHKEMNDILFEITRHYLKELDSETPRDDLFKYVAYLVLLSAFDVYRATCKLVVEDPILPAQALILSRSLVDSVLNIVFLCSNPDDHVALFFKSCYRDQLREIDLFRDNYGNDPEWTDYIKQEENNANRFPDRFEIEGLNEITAKSPIPFPNPSGMLRNNPYELLDNTFKFLKDFHAYEYPRLSQISHQHMGGITLSIMLRGATGEVKKVNMKDDALVYALRFLIIILSEIDVVFKFKKVDAVLSVWETLIIGDTRARKYYDMRYKALLKQ